MPDAQELFEWFWWFCFTVVWLQYMDYKGHLKPVVGWILRLFSPLVLRVNKFFIKWLKATVEDDPNEWPDLPDDFGEISEESKKLLGPMFGFVPADNEKAKKFLAKCQECHEHPSDEYDRRTANGERLNLITGEYESSNN